jgi:hypothetical protein
MMPDMIVLSQKVMTGKKAVRDCLSDFERIAICAASEQDLEGQFSL